MNPVLMSAAVFLLSFCIQLNLLSPMPEGGISEELSRDDNIEEFIVAEGLLKDVWFSLPEEHQACNNSEIDKLRTQLVAGINYFFDTTLYCADNVTLACHVEIYHKPWLNETSLTNSTCV